MVRLPYFLYNVIVSIYTETTLLIICILEPTPSEFLEQTRNFAQLKLIRHIRHISTSIFYM